MLESNFVYGPPEMSER
jgi:hypothetical protein